VAKTRISGVGKTPRSNMEIIRDIAVKKRAKNPRLIEEIERIAREFQRRELSGEVPDLPAALEQFRREIESVGARSPLPPKDPGPKTGPSKGTAHRHKIPHQASSVPKKRRKRTPTKHKPSKRLFKK
jgi:hypothetical protein